MQYAHPKRFPLSIIVLATAATLAACGGGSTGDYASADASGGPQLRQAAAAPVLHTPDGNAGLAVAAALPTRSEALDAERGLVIEPEAPAADGLAALPAPEFDGARWVGHATGGRRTMLAGTGLSVGLASGCNPVVGSDFIDSPTWQQRRLAPRDCELLTVNPPLFVWRQPSDRLLEQPWTFTIRSAAGAQVLQTQPSSPAQRLTQPLPTGSYEWAVSYVRKSDGATVISQSRRFVVPAGARVFVAPGGQELAARVAAKQAPRLLAAGASFAALAASAQSGALAQAYRAFLQSADNLVTAPVASEPTPNPASPGAPGWSAWMSEVHQLALKERTAVESLGLAWRLNGDARYLEAAKRHVAALGSWQADGTTGHQSSDQANRVLAQALAIGLDLFGSELDADTNRRAALAVRDRVAPIIGEYAGLGTVPYDSHLVTTVQIATEALLLVAGHPAIPESAAWLATSWDIAQRSMSTWGDVRGSWGNGVAYGWWALGNAARFLAVAALSSGVDAAQEPWAYNFGDFLMAMTPPGSLAMNAMGDGIETGKLYAQNLTAFRLYATLTRKPAHAWYWQATTQGSQRALALQFLLAGLQQSQPAPVAPTQASALYQDAGVVAMHDNPAATAERSSVYFRSSRFGSFNHSHADQNAFTYVSRGKDLLVSGGYYPWYLSEHHAAVGRATRYKNALTFDGGIGQAEPVAEPGAPGKPMMSMDARGELVNYADSGGWSVATGDAALAYRGWDGAAKVWQPLLDNAIRTVAYHRKQRVLVVYDWATSATPRQWELNFNALGAFTPQDGGAKVSYDGASACLSVHGLPGGFRVTSGFDVAPEQSRPQQYQARYVAGARSGELAAVTVIRDDCRALPVSVQFTGRAATVNLGPAAPLTFDGRIVLLSK